MIRKNWQKLRNLIFEVERKDAEDELHNENHISIILDLKPIGRHNVKIAECKYKIILPPREH